MGHVAFNQSGYTSAIERALEKAMKKVTDEVMRAILNNFGALNIRELDRKFVRDMKQSIRVANTKTVNSIMSQFKAGYEGTPNQSFRVVYYEYGTGSLMRPPKNYSPTSDPSWNPARPKNVGEVIWSRPKGKWRDAGGNIHTSDTKGKPRPLSLKSPLGQPVHPQHWFERGFWQGTKNLDKYVLDAVKSVPISSYISIARIYKRM